MNPTVNPIIPIISLKNPQNLFNKKSLIFKNGNCQCTVLVKLGLWQNMGKMGKISS